MNLAELHKKVAETLGVSISQKELAFELLTEAIADVLTEGITLKVPILGYFQLKQPAKGKSYKQLLYSSLPGDFATKSKTLFLTIDLVQKAKTFSESDSSIFSIGVGKPLIPLFDEENQHNTETSFAMLKKSIEERVKELIAESDQIPNFNLMDWVLEEEEAFDEETLYLPKSSNSNDEFTSTNDFLENDNHTAIDSYSILNELLNDNIQIEKPEDIITDDNSNTTWDDNDILKDINNEEYLEINTTSFLDLSVSDLMDDSDDTDSNVTKIVLENYDEPEITGTDDTELEITEPEITETYYSEPEITEPEIAEQEIIEPVDYFTIDTLLNDSVDNSIEEVKDSKAASESIDEALDKIAKSFFYPEGTAEVKNEDAPNNKIFDTEKRYELQDDVIEEMKEVKSESDTSFDEEIIKNISEYTSTPAFVEVEDELKLKEIVDDELKEVEGEQTSEANSRILNDLLQAKKLEITKEEDLEPADEGEILSNTKIEWNWGDELKEEFGIGSEPDEVEETFPLMVDLYKEEKIEEKKKVEKIEERKKEENKDPDTKDDLKARTKELEQNIYEELRKTKQDLFDRLERTLEREVSLLKEEIIHSYVIEQNQNRLTSEKKKSFEEASFLPAAVQDDFTPAENIEFKDEKVFLDFKTPPPKYEFVEEKSQTKLEKPKRITILLSPEEKAVEENPDTSYQPEIQTILPEVKKKNYGKIVAFVLFSLIVVAGISSYYLFFLKADASKKNVEAQVQNQNNPINTTTYSAQENIKTDLPVDSLLRYEEEFSDFPTTATAPVPIKPYKEEASADLDNSTQINNSSIKKNIPQITLQKTESNIKESSDAKSLAGNVNSNSSVKETSLSNLIFFDGKTYSFQISSWNNYALADKEVKRLRDLGFNAFIVEAFVPQKKGTWYRIRIGYFSTEEEARNFRTKNNF